LLLALATLAGCAAKIPFEGDRSKVRIAQDLGVPPESILRQDRCVISRYDGGRSAPGFECIYIATTSYAAVLDFDKTSGRFKEAVRISKDTDAVAYVTQGTIVGPLAQIQVRHGPQHYCVEFVNADLGQIGHQGDLREAYEQLRSIGIAETESWPYVRRQARPFRMMVVVIPRAGR
jgi:hypothetical protein